MMIKNNRGGGGGTSSRNCKNSSLKDYFYTLNCEKQQDTHTNYKIKYAKEKTATQLLLWFLALCVFAAFSLCPLAAFSTRHNLRAGEISSEVFFTNAPVFVAGDRDYDNESERDEAVGSADASTGELNASASAKPLFAAQSGSNLGVDLDVLSDLLTMIDSKSVWNGVKANADGITYLTAKNFGQYGDQTNWTNEQKGNAQIVVQLFSSGITSYWQAVYRTIDAENDILTLYMTDAVDSYDMFNSSYGYGYGRYYGSGLYNSCIQYFQSYGKPYLASPSELPGKWQSNEYQTSARGGNGTTEITGNWISDKSGATVTPQSGASGAGPASSDLASEYSTTNGLDNFGDGWDLGADDNSGVYNGKAYDCPIFIPSWFEVLYTGYQPQTGAKLSKYDGDTAIGYIEDYENVTASSTQSNSNRTGLWELNAYDRASENASWLRSGSSTANNYWGNLNKDGNGFFVPINTGALFGFRAAIHLDLKGLREYYSSGYLFEVTASASNDFSSEDAPICEIVLKSTEYGNESLPTNRAYLVENPEYPNKYDTIIARFTEVNSKKIKSFTIDDGAPIDIDGETGSGTDYTYTYRNNKLIVEFTDYEWHNKIVVNGYTTTNLNLSATNNATNSLLILTILDANTNEYIAEYSCVSGVITQSVSLKYNKTYKILATRPFGSRLYVELNGGVLAPSNFACYMISTGNSSSINLSFTLTGSGEWKNCIVI